MSSRFLVAVALLLSIGFGCSQLPRETTSGPDVDAINQVREREFAAFSEGHVDRLVAVFTQDCVLMPPNQRQVTGEDALRRWAQDIADQFTISGGYTGSRITVVGDWAIERYSGVLSLTSKTGGAKVEEQIKGIHVYRRQPDGSWRIAQDVWNSDAPADAGQ